MATWAGLVVMMWTYTCNDGRVYFYQFPVRAPKETFLQRTTSRILLSAAQVFVGLLEVASLKVNQSDEIVGSRLDPLSRPLPRPPPPPWQLMPWVPAMLTHPGRSSLEAGCWSSLHIQAAAALLAIQLLIENLQMKLGSGCSDPAEQCTGSEPCRTLEAAWFFCFLFYLFSPRKWCFHITCRSWFWRRKRKRWDRLCVIHKAISFGSFYFVLFSLAQVCCCCCCCSRCCALRFDLFQQRSHLFVWRFHLRGRCRLLNEFLSLPNSASLAPSSSLLSSCKTTDSVSRWLKNKEQ